MFYTDRSKSFCVKKFLKGSVVLRMYDANSVGLFAWMLNTGQNDEKPRDLFVFCSVKNVFGINIVSWFLFFRFTSWVSDAFGSSRKGGYETETAWFFEIKRALYMLTIISRGDWLWFIQWCCRLSCWPTQSFASAFWSTICYWINQWAFLLFSLFKMIGMLFNVRRVLRGHWLTTLEKTCENIEQRNLSGLSLLYH